MNLLQDILDCLPGLLGNWWHILPVGESITTSTNLLDGTLDKGTLGNAGTEEDGVKSQENPAALDEDDCGTEKTEPQSELEPSNQRHAGVIVLLDKSAKGVTKTRRGRLLASWGGWWRRDCWKQDGAGVGQDVESAVNGEWQQSERVLLRNEPNEGHC